MNDFLNTIKKYTTTAIAIVALILSVLTAVSNALPKEAPPTAVTNQGVSNLDTLQTGDGTVSEPAFGFTSDTNTGMYRVGADNLGLAVGGSKIVDVNSGGLSATTITVTNLISTAVGFTGATADLTGAITANSGAFTETVTADGFSGTYLTGTLGTAAQTNVTSVGDLTSLAVGGGYSSTGCDLTSVGNINCAGNAAFGGDAVITGTTTAGTVYVNGYLRSSNGPVTAFDDFTALKAFTATQGIIINGNTYTVTDPVTVTGLCTNCRVLIYQIP